MEEKKQVVTKVETEPKQRQESIVISQKGKNTRNIPEVVFVVRHLLNKEKVEEYFEKFGERIYDEMNMLYK
jgi:hypothetical protein